MLPAGSPTKHINTETNLCKLSLFYFYEIFSILASGENSISTRRYPCSKERTRKGRFIMRKTLKGAALAAISLTCLGAADAGDYQYIGDVILNGSSFCPRNTLPAEGQTLDIEPRR